MKFSQSDYKKLERIEHVLRELSRHYGYHELKEVAIAFMKVMRDASIEEPTPTWDEEKPFSHA